jgi:uncharacterized protein
MSGSAVPPSMSGPERDVRCPGCGQSCKYGPSNPSRPFCSPRCRNADFGAWASESYRVAANATPDDEDAPPPEA